MQKLGYLAIGKIIYKVKNGNIYSSLDVSLNNGNINELQNLNFLFPLRGMDPQK